MSLNDQYFTDREDGPRSRTVETIGDRVWGGLFSVISSGLSNQSFGWRFPEECPDGGAAAGCDEHALQLRFCADMPSVEWPLSASDTPATPVVLDILEFFAASVGTPSALGFHSYFRHEHLAWDRESGLKTFVAEVNAIFVRNGIALELTAEGKARRTLPMPIAETLSRTTCVSGDGETDTLVSTAIGFFLSPKLADRRLAVEKLWDAFERIKTLEPGVDKRESATALLDRVAAPGSALRENLEAEAATLTKMGNTFRIRHSEVNQEILRDAGDLDYAFMRMFAFVLLVLRATGRIAT
jgi:hypothetical protein